MNDDDIDNIVAAILATANDSPKVALNRYEQLRQLLADKREAELPEAMKETLNKVKGLREARQK
jgi:hypothetical protein